MPWTLQLPSLHSFTGVNRAASTSPPLAACMEASKCFLVLLDTEDNVKIAPDFVAPEEFAEEAGLGDGRRLSPERIQSERPDQSRPPSSMRETATCGKPQLAYGSSYDSSGSRY